MPNKKVNHKEIEQLKKMLQELALKVQCANEENDPPPKGEKPLESKSEAKKGSSDSMADKYRAAYSFVYDALPHWKRQVIDEKLYNDRIYKEFTKEVISNAEGE